MNRNYDVIDAATGEPVLMVRHLWPGDPVECCMCSRETFDQWAVPYYERPVLEGHSEGGYRAACEPCYGRWEAWNDATLRAIDGATSEVASAKESRNG